MSRLLTIGAFLCAVATTAEGAAIERPLNPGEELPYRVSFPRHDRVLAEGGTHQFVAEERSEGGSYAAAWKLAFDLDFPDEEIWWQLRHTARVRWEPQRPAGWDLRVSLLAADYLRHDTSSYILIPARRDIRLPAPFDVAVAWKLGGGRFLLDAAEPAVVGWDVGEFQVMADFIRDPRYRHRFAIGASSRYGLVPDTEGWSHELVPLSGAAALYSWENLRGTFAVRLEGETDYGATLALGADPQWGWTSRGAFLLEWVPIAINDLPVSLFLDANWEHTWSADPVDEWGVRGGLRVSLPLGL